MGEDRVRDQHQPEVLAFLQEYFQSRNWEIGMPPFGTGNETYLARNQGQALFIKLGSPVERYQVMSALGLSPRVVAVGELEDGTSLLVQQQIRGRNPSRKDFQRYLDQFALAIRKTHHCQGLKSQLPGRPSELHKDAGLEVLEGIQRRWEANKAQVPAFAAYVDGKIAELAEQISQFPGSGLVASHNDICCGNWLISDEEKVYLIDYDSMSQDDPALDLGAILWWYYPPEMRADFLAIAGYPADDDFRTRMRVRMAVHNLNIILPREGSFDADKFDRFDQALEDFRAVVSGQENPQGYAD